MNISSVYNDLVSLSSDLESAICRLKKRIDASDSNLIIKKSNKYDRYYAGAGRASVYLGKDKIDLLAALVQKKYESNLCKMISQQQKIVEQLLSIIDKNHDFLDLDMCISTIPEQLRQYVLVDKVTSEGYANAWQAEKYTGLSVPASSPFYTKKGEHVRSKSEIIIADRLYTNNIPYHYEKPIKFKGHQFQFPDFTILNKKTGEQLFWEHFGLLDRADYISESQLKLETFASAGIFPGHGLIITFESNQRPLSTKYVDLLIEKFLV